MSVNLSLLAGAGWQFFTDDGVPLAGGLLYTYAAGTTTPQTTYTTSAGVSTNTNPIVLNSAGRLANEIWLTEGVSYKFVLKTAVAVQIGSYDDISGANDFAAVFVDFAAPSGSSLIGFLQAGTGAVARTVQSKLRDVVSVKDFGAVGDNSNDDTGAIQAAIDAVELAGGGVVYFPAAPAGYKITAALTIQKTGVFLVGDGPKASILTPNFATGECVVFGDTNTLVEDAGMSGIGIVHVVTRTADASVVLGGNLVRAILEDVRISAAYRCIQYGRAASPVTTSDCTLRNVHMQGTNDGIEVTGQASLFLEHCRLNGTPTNSSRGINVSGPMDGLWLDSETTIEGHDNSISITHTAGSVANIFLNGCALDRPLVAGLRINISGTASINGIYADGVKVFDTVGSGDAPAILVTSSSSGAIDGLEIMNWSARDTRQEFADINAVVSNLTISNCVSLRGGVKSSGNYAGINLRSLAHNHVVINSNIINGSYSYGLINADATTNISVTGNDFTGNVTGAVSNLGGVSSTRYFSDNAGVAVNASDLQTKTAVALADAAATLTAAQMVDSSLFTITPSAARILTTDTAANIIAAIPRYQVGTTFYMVIINNAAFQITLDGGVGVTRVGTTTIATVGSGMWWGRIDSPTAVTMYRT